MRNEFSRSQILLGASSMEKLKNSRVAVFGLGGVGSFAAEALVRTGSMVQNADQIGPAVTTGEDPRITRVGKFIRRLRLDEFSQLLNVLNGTMSLVGPRPEVRKYVDLYTPEQMATLLVRPGVTAPSSIAFKDEDQLLDAAEDPEKVYAEQILPPKMELNLEYLEHVSPLYDLSVLFQTVAAVFLPGRDKDAQ